MALDFTVFGWLPQARFWFASCLGTSGTTNPIFGAIGSLLLVGAIASWHSARNRAHLGMALAIILPLPALATPWALFGKRG